MTVPLDLQPMLAKAVTELPDGPEWHFEPKWDGFRCLVHRTESGVELVSRSGKSLNRYFPELVDDALASLPSGLVLDGELVVAVDDRLDWDALSARVHPAASRVAELSRRTPAFFVAFDLVANEGRSLLDEPFGERRAQLLGVLVDRGHTRWRVTMATQERDVALTWFAQFEGAGLDGVVAKSLDAAYAPGGRAMRKLKHRRTADVVLMGLRPHKASTDDQPLVGALQVGLQVDGGLHPVGGVTAFSMNRRAELAAELASLVDGVRDGTPHRWNSGRDATWTALRPERVMEVAYDQLEGARFRHTAAFLRWRPDRDPDSCTLDQLEVPVRYSLAEVLHD
jgi:ATP-dependent DNA ligase